MSTAPYLPVEIVEQILSYTDGRTLFRCSMVSTTWRNVFERLSRKKELWKRLCFEELEMDEMSEMLSELYPFSRMINYYSDPDINWFVVYRNCKSPRGLTSSIEQISTIELCGRSAINRTINCMKLSGDCVIIGNTDGGIYLVDSSGLIGHVTQHLEEVTDFALFSFSREFDDKNRLRAKHEFIVSTSQDSNIQINKIPLRFCSHKCNVSAKSKIVLETHNAATLMIRAHEDYFVVTSVDMSLTIWKLTPPPTDKPHGMPEPTLITLIHQHSNTLLASSLWARILDCEQSLNFTAIADKGRVLKICAYPHEGSSSKVNLFWTQQVSNVPSVVDDLGAAVTHEDRFQCNIFKGYIWRGIIFAWITAFYSLCISIDGVTYREYSTLADLNGVPRSILIFGHFFFLGLNNGDVVIYFFEKPGDLMSLDLSKVLRRITMCNGPISHLAISITDEATKLVASTETSLHLTTIY